MRQPYPEIPIYVGTMYDPEDYGSKFSHIVTLGPEEFSETTELHLFNDGPHEYEKFESAVDTVLHLLETTDDQILVQCQAGTSRSVTVTATAISLYTGEPFMDVLYVVSRTGVDPAQELLQSAKRYITDNDGLWGYDPTQEQ